MNPLLQKKCAHATVALTEAQIAQYLRDLSGWQMIGGKFVKTFEFPDYYRTLAFVNAIAWVIHREDHHPELTVTYNRCTVRFDTQSVNNGRGGISENDFIAAAERDALFAL